MPWGLNVLKSAIYYQIVAFPNLPRMPISFTDILIDPPLRAFVILSSGALNIYRVASCVKKLFMKRRVCSF